MERLWTPWRLAYISGGRGSPLPKGVPEELGGWPAEFDQNCVFCNMIAAVQWAIAEGMSEVEAERAALILKRGSSCFVCLNRYPYSTGHVMIVPFAHEASLARLDSEAAMEMIGFAQRLESAIREVYAPDGLNLGMNLGEAAGAGVAEHLHLHELPRWTGDTNFMTVTADTRILPEELAVTWERLRSVLTKVQLL